MASGVVKKKILENLINCLLSWNMTLKTRGVWGIFYYLNILKYIAAFICLNEIQTNPLIYQNALKQIHWHWLISLPHNMLKDLFSLIHSVMGQNNYWNKGQHLI